MKLRGKVSSAAGAKERDQSMTKRILLLMVLLSLFSGSLKAQYKNITQLEQSLQQAIQKAYRASVIIWKYDTLNHRRSGGQFSGVVVTASGQLLTAAHASVPGETYQVLFPDGRSGIAQGMGEITLAAEPGTPDVAMMQLLGNARWPFAEMGWSHSLKKNQPCISIAYPETLAQHLPMVRFGYIDNPRGSNGFIQSTCLMEPGDSGGPLFDCFGRVIALHSSIDISENANYEIPVDLYRKYWTALNKAVTYTSYPLQKDAIGKDPKASSIKTLTDAVAPRAGFGADNFPKEGSLLISSTLKDQPQHIQGTLFRPEGLAYSLIVTKGSMIGTAPTTEIAGRSVALQILARDKANDLVLLKADELIAGSIAVKSIVTDTLNFASLGKLLFSPLGNHSSVISVAGSLQLNIAKMMSIGYLGVHVAYSGPLLFNSVQPATPAAGAGLQEGDELLEINGVKLNSRADYVRESVKYWSGDTITVTIKRKDTSYKKEVILSGQPEVAGGRAARFAGERSIRRDGFSRVFAHDARLKPGQCGGPVFDSKGRFYGINIARASRVSTLVVPAATVAAFIQKAVPGS